jgi:hypothetical protein
VVTKIAHEYRNLNVEDADRNQKLNERTMQLNLVKELNSPFQSFFAVSASLAI